MVVLGVLGHLRRRLDSPCGKVFTPSSQNLLLTAPQLTVPETRASIILEKKAKRVRKQLRAEGFDSAADNLLDADADEKKSLHTLFAITLTRPIRFLFTEP